MYRNMKANTLNVFSLLCLLAVPVSAETGDTLVAKWKDDRSAAFLLYFDDGWPSHWQIAIPELVKRDMIATFYLNPEKGEYKKFEDKWINEIPKTGMVYADHTMTHQGVKDLENAEWEIGACAEYIRKITGKNGLLSYGQPGVPEGKWNITPEELDTLLEKNRLISRSKMEGHMAVYHLKTTDEMLALADSAIAGKGVEYITIHGVERITPDWGYQDFWALEQKVFFPFLDGLKERADRNDLWITDHISQYKYAVQRDAAQVKLLREDAKVVELELQCSADAKVFDAALTLVTEVPASWKKITATQGGKSVSVVPKDGVVKFDALPGKILLTAE